MAKDFLISIWPQIPLALFCYDKNRLRKPMLQYQYVGICENNKLKKRVSVSL